MKSLPAVSLALLLTAGTALAQPPCPELSVVPRVIPLTADGSLEYVVGPMWKPDPLNCQVQHLAVGATIEIRFPAMADDAICWCDPDPGPTPHVITGVTDGQGKATFRIRAGGCIPIAPGVPAFAAEVFMDGVKMQECGTVSPDLVDSEGRRTTEGWDPGGTCGIGLSDAVELTGPFSTSTYDWCADVNGDNAVGLSDAVLASPALANAITCPGN
jgi:hypothetical protein